MAVALGTIHRDPPPPADSGARALLADVRAGVQAHATVLAERDRLQYRIAPLLALERAMERRPWRWVMRPARRAWGAARRRMKR
jgi:hypothetical protein